MSEPQTELDARYSQPDAVAVPWATTLAAIEAAPLFWITTVRPDGRPHSTPLVAVWLDDALHFTTGGHEQKGRNLTTNPHVLLTTGDNRWDDGTDVIVEGDAVRLTDHDRLVRLAAAWRDKSDGRWKYGVTDDGFAHDDGAPVQVFQVTPTAAWAFGKQPFSHTRYTFTQKMT